MLFTKCSNYFSLHNRGFVLSLLLAVCTVYSPFLGNPFFFDDLPFFSSGINAYTQNGFNFDLRWLPYASLALTRTLFLDTPHFYHLGNMLLHAANVILLFALMYKLITLTIKPNESTISPIWAAWFAALFFACNPVAVYAVGYVIERSILMATLFLLAMQLAYLHGLINGQKRWLAVSVFFYFLAVFSKEHSLMAPAIVVATTIMLRSNIKVNWHALWSTWLSYLLIALLVILRVKGIFGTTYEHDAGALLNQQSIAEDTTTLHLLSVITQSGLFFKYLLLWWIPNPAWMSIDMREPFLASWQTWTSLLNVGVFFSYGILAFILLLKSNKLRVVGWALLYPWLLFIPEFSTIRIQETFVLYRSYLWIPGMLVLIALATMMHSKKSVMVVAISITLLLVPFSWNRLSVMADNYRLWDDAAALLKNDTTPGASRIFFNRGDAELSKGKWSDALSDYERVINIDSKIGQAYTSSGVAFFNLKNYQKAIVAFDQAISINPNDAQAYFGKGITLKRLHMDNDALEAIEKSCELKNLSACLIISMSKAKNQITGN